MRIAALVGMALVISANDTFGATDKERTDIIAYASLLITQKAVCQPLDQSRNAQALLMATKSAGLDLTDAKVNAEVIQASILTTQLASQLIAQSQITNRQWCQNTQTSLDKARENELWEIVSGHRGPP